MRRVSKKLAPRLAEYARLRVQFLRDHPLCEACIAFGNDDARPSTEVHHVRHRGRFLNVVSTWLAVDAECHRLIHASPRRARELALLE